MHHNSWLDLPLSVYLVDHDYPGALLLEYYTLRDIKKGEELFMDYGADWQAAWDLHQQNWQPVTGDGYVYPQDMSRDMIPTLNEQKTNPLPKNIATVCWSLHWYPPDDIESMPWERPNIKWPEGMIDCQVLARRPVTAMVVDGDNTVTTHTGKEQPVQYEYDVRLLLPKGRKFINTNVAGDAVYFVDKPYTSDLHLPEAFRQPMTFPKDLIPDSWKVSLMSQ
jgi:hypothetical protein